jgi:hypothetical protein
MVLPDLGLPSYMGRLTSGKLHDAMEAGDGFATFTCEDEDSLLGIAQEYGFVMPHRDADARGVTHLRDIPELGPKRGVGLTKSALMPHTDRPAIKRPPRVLLLWCSQASADGGDALVVRGTDVTGRLGELDPSALRALCEPDAAIFRTGTDEVVSPVFRVAEGVLSEVRLRFDPFVYYYVDAARSLPSLERALKETERVFPLAPGTGYAVRNDLWLHGRRAYAGDREMKRIMIEDKRGSTGEPLAHLAEF